MMYWPITFVDVSDIAPTWMFKVRFYPLFAITTNFIMYWPITFVDVSNKASTWTVLRICDKYHHLVGGPALLF